MNVVSHTDPPCCDGLRQYPHLYHLARLIWMDQRYNEPYLGNTLPEELAEAELSLAEIPYSVVLAYVTLDTIDVPSRLDRTVPDVMTKVHNLFCELGIVENT